MAVGPEVSQGPVGCQAQLKKYVESITCFRLNSPEGSKGEVRVRWGWMGEVASVHEGSLSLDCAAHGATPQRGQAEPDGLADTGLRD